MLTRMKLTPTAHAFAAIALFFCAIAQAQDAAERAKKSGELLTLKNQRVLKLFGPSLKERGFAHGYLLAEDIRDDLDGALTSLPKFGAARYETKLIPFARDKFVWDADIKEELEGIFEGMTAKLGKEGMVSAVLKRPLKFEDTLAMNALADYFGPACSGFAAWDSRTDKGEVVHARTLDFPLGPKPVADQIVLAVDPLPAQKGRPAKQAWIAVGWPGLAAQFSGMNDKGLVACIHDGYNTVKGGKEEDFFARGILLRRMLEEINPNDGDAAEIAAKMAGQRRSACGNLFHLTWSSTAAKKTNTLPSAVLEVETAEIGARIRRMDKTGVLVLTNHFCVRNAPVECARFSSIQNGIQLLQQASRPLGLTEARKLLLSAEQPVAAHSVYFFPDRLEMQVAITKGNLMSPRIAPTAFSFSELFAK